MVEDQEVGTRVIRHHIERSEIGSWGEAGGRNRRLTCFTNLCDKNGQYFGFVHHIYFCLFKLFMNIFTSCRNSIL